MEYARRGYTPRVPMSTAWPGLNSNDCSRRSSVSRRERGVIAATLTSGTDTVGTEAKCTRSLPRRRDRQATDASYSVVVLLSTRPASCRFDSRLWVLLS